MAARSPMVDRSRGGLRVRGCRVWAWDLVERRIGVERSWSPVAMLSILVWQSLLGWGNARICAAARRWL